MRIETWDHFITVVENIKPALSIKNKGIAIVAINWGKVNKNRYEGLNQDTIDKALNWILKLTEEFTGAGRKHLAACWWFLNTLNTKCKPDDFETKAGCVAHNFYWWSGRCHIEAKPPPPEPPKPPEPEPPEPEPKPPKPSPEPPKPPEPEPPPLDIGLPWQQIQKYADLLMEFYADMPAHLIGRRVLVKTLVNWLKAIAGFLKWREEKGK